MQVQKINLNDEAGILKSMVISTGQNENDVLKKFFTDGEINENGKKRIRKMWQQKHVSVFFHGLIKVCGYGVEDTWRLNLTNEELQGVKWNLQSDNFKPFGEKTYYFTVYGACIFCEDKRVPIRIRRELIKELQENYPTLYEEFRKTSQIQKTYSNLENQAMLKFISLRLKVPFFVKAQLDRSRVGFAINEVSRRYVNSEPDFYIFDIIRTQNVDIKQGSNEDKFVPSTVYDNEGAYGQEISEETLISQYMSWRNIMLLNNACREQVSRLSPQTAMTEFVWTGSLFAFARMLKLRLASDTQKETREVAKDIYNIIQKTHPEIQELI
jgi:thymidylate synthase (FAD)